jgi:lipopolysaccharide export system protein LptA
VRKYVLSIILLLIAVAAMCQKKSVVNLVHSTSSTGIKLNGKDVIKVYQGTFKQDYSTLTSDSAYFYPQDNAFDAFGHVIINQGDTLNIYSDKLNYNGNTKTAILTDNVRMVDKDATLTTNHLTYNTATRIGIYTDGGKLVNKDNTLLSKNGYYFAFTRDSYFRYNVSLTTPDALVITDTMRYNTGTKISYFYGPTHIYSLPKKGEKKKDQDTLYTENGYYNTVIEQAAFGKNNLYKSGTKSLKGDSLFYDKLKGYGRAVMHVTFKDEEQKTTIKGNLGTYFKEKELTVMTQDPYVIMVTEKKDSTETDSTTKTKSDSVSKADAAIVKSLDKTKGVGSMDQLIKQTIPTHSIPVKDINMKPDSALKKLNIPNKDINTKADSALRKLHVLGKDTLQKADSILRKQAAANKGLVTLADSALKKASKNKELRSKADSVLKNAPAVLKAAASSKQNQQKVKDLVKSKTGKELPDTTLRTRKDTGKTKLDSIFMSADTIETQIMTYKDLKVYQEKQRLAHIRDTTGKANKPKVQGKESKYLTATYVGLSRDSSFFHSEYFGKPKPKVVKKKPVKAPTKKQLMLDSLQKKQTADSIDMAKKLEPSDTARIRIIIGHHHFKMFKSDLQAKSDSMFYSGADSTMRCYVNPMMWTEGSQLSGDTIHLQMKHKKLDNMTMWPNAFIVNTEKKDSVHFNQVGGKRMRGFFKNDKLWRMFIEGNAESIYFSRDSAKNTISGMQRSLSSRIRVDFKNNKVTTLAFYTKPENKYGPLTKFKEDDRLLKGFIWKPKDRPVSKESIIPSYTKKATAAATKAAGKDTKNGKGPAKKAPGSKVISKDTTQNKQPGILNGIKTGKDSTAASPLKTGKDSVLKTDTVKIKVNAPPVKMQKDTVKKSAGN